MHLDRRPGRQCDRLDLPRTGRIMSVEDIPQSAVIRGLM
jgi:hypothetical protein